MVIEAILEGRHELHACLSCTLIHSSRMTKASRGSATTEAAFPSALRKLLRILRHMPAACWVRFLQMQHQTLKMLLTLATFPKVNSGRGRCTINCQHRTWPSRTLCLPWQIHTHQMSQWATSGSRLWVLMVLFVDLKTKLTSRRKQPRGHELPSP